MKTDKMKGLCEVHIITSGVTPVTSLELIPYEMAPTTGRDKFITFIENN